MRHIQCCAAQATYMNHLYGGPHDHAVYPAHKLTDLLQCLLVPATEKKPNTWSKVSDWASIAVLTAMTWTQRMAQCDLHSLSLRRGSYCCIITACCACSLSPCWTACATTAQAAATQPTNMTGQWASPPYACHDSSSDLRLTAHRLRWSVICRQGCPPVIRQVCEAGQVICKHAGQTLTVPPCCPKSLGACRLAPSATPPSCVKDLFPHSYAARSDLQQLVSSHIANRILQRHLPVQTLTA